MAGFSVSSNFCSNPIYGYFARTNELPENYCVFEVNYDDVFMEFPLRTRSWFTLPKTPPLKPRRKGIEFPCKNLFGDFLHCDEVAEEVVLYDNWKYEGFSLDGYIDVGGSSTCCDLVHESVVYNVHESVVYNGQSLPNIDTECFANDVVLDVVVPDTLAYTLLSVLKKRRNKVNVTRKRRCLNNSKTIRLRKGLGKRVACGANNQRLCSLIGLNVHVGDDDPQVTTQVSLTGGSFNNDVNDFE
nr:hypothetical protein [Tanacetum cinerariifolium]GFA25994.1 hypothetical protein [Tanacetum cinerariifolium]